ncbi:hypothetical protein IM282_15370 [Enterobacter cloacae complex sp. P29RS]|uniref:hypothetical protein n=1 Tax=Enterobacter cloacae complex sp. P29RS TaxID=2779563 RepID=UPI001868FDBC|nr:hypothetical protein [Enterobacter cloacae complex sp. P29RS]MBE3175357.1 hypothetical protein [Enterobacter cloacae complex sp. P29RS]
MNKLKTTWKGFRLGHGSVEGNGFEIPIAIPEVFGGVGTGANPKDMLKASAA